MVQLHVSSDYQRIDRIIDYQRSCDLSVVFVYVPVTSCSLESSPPTSPLSPGHRQLAGAFGSFGGFGPSAASAVTAAADFGIGQVDHENWDDEEYDHNATGRQLGGGDNYDEYDDGTLAPIPEAEVPEDFRMWGESSTWQVRGAMDGKGGQRGGQMGEAEAGRCINE